MIEHEVRLEATAGIFRGLAMQNMMFHQCIAELVDNAIAAKPANRTFKVDIVFVRPSDDQDSADVYIADNSRGMSLEVLKKALQLGESATTDSRLNEHGYGMKNALATLSGGNGPWSIWTKAVGSQTVCQADGPFGATMKIKEGVAFPTMEFLPTDISTLIAVRVRMSLVQTVQGRGAPSTDLVTLRSWLIEHLGVTYRGYLEQDAESCESVGSIVVSVSNDSLRVPPVPVPMGRADTTYIDVELGGQARRLEYSWGTLDAVKRDRLVRGSKTKYYYQGNIKTQGIDIRLGKRVIATRQLETIWKTEDGRSPLARHNNYNEFVGELLIPELPRGVLTTTNSKTDFNLDDPDWCRIFDKLNGSETRPIKQVREKSESALREKWMAMLKATNPDDIVTDESAVWPTATRIDVFRRTPDDKIIIYELKVTSGTPQYLYQLRMYWDGLVLAGQQPKEAILLVDDFGTTLEEMANSMNKLPPPYFPPAVGQKSKPVQSAPYNFRIERHRDKGL